MNRRTYFLECLGAHLTAIAATPASNSTIVRVYGWHPEIRNCQSLAWKIPEEAIPADDPAGAAAEFFRYCFGTNPHYREGPGPKPAWLEEWEETLTSEKETDA